MRVIRGAIVLCPLLVFRFVVAPKVGWNRAAVASPFEAVFDLGLARVGEAAKAASGIGFPKRRPCADNGPSRGRDGTAGADPRGSFDHLVGRRQQQGRDGEAERSRAVASGGKTPEAPFLYHHRRAARRSRLLSWCERAI
jgi:hypothetical protein